ncbi:MAG: hypothetical protein ABIN36_02365 [Ferruginibacter sp.]
MKPAINSNPRDLIVKESAVVLSITAIVFICMLASIFEYNTNLGVWGYVIVAILIPAAFYFIRRKIQKAVMIINKNGIIYYGKLITDWSHFKSAKIDQLPLSLGDPRDKVVLVVQYMHPTQHKLFEQKLRLNNTFNKSEEQILAAIESFRNFK